MTKILWEEAEFLEPVKAPHDHIVVKVPTVRRTGDICDGTPLSHYREWVEKTVSLHTLFAASDDDMGFALGAMREYRRRTQAKMREREEAEWKRQQEKRDRLAAAYSGGTAKLRDYQKAAVDNLLHAMRLGEMNAFLNGSNKYAGTSVTKVVGDDEAEWMKDDGEEPKKIGALQITGHTNWSDLDDHRTDSMRYAREMLDKKFAFVGGRNFGKMDAAFEEMKKEMRRAWEMGRTDFRFTCYGRHPQYALEQQIKFHNFTARCVGVDHVTDTKDFLNFHGLTTRVPVAHRIEYRFELDPVVHAPTIKDASALHARMEGWNKIRELLDSGRVTVSKAWTEEQRRAWLGGEWEEVPRRDAEPKKVTIADVAKMNAAVLNDAAFAGLIESIVQPSGFFRGVFTHEMKINPKPGEMIITSVKASTIDLDDKAEWEDDDESA